MHHALMPLASGLLPKWLDASYILTQLGPYLLPVVALIIFAECGLLVGFFLPGDSLLFTLGLFIATGTVGVPMWVACVVLSACAVVGNVAGYGIGYAIGPRLFNKPDSRLFRKEYVDKTHAFFEKYGARAVLLARLVPIVRTFITAVAGVGRMDPRRYFTYTIIGGIVWASGITILGYFLGQIGVVRDHLELFLIAIVLVSVIPIVIEWARSRKERKLAVPTETDQERTTVLPRVRD